MYRRGRGETAVKWLKLGRIFAPSGTRWWARSYATVPTAHVLDDTTIRVYFAALDEHRHGRIGFVDLDARDPRRIQREGPEPVFDIGRPGMFDDSGVTPSCVQTRGGDRRLYYVGWQRSQRVPYHLFTGLATIRADGAVERMQHTPILERTSSEPYLRSAATVLEEADGFRCWYVSGQGWTTKDGHAVPTYVIRTATSADGLAWRAEDAPCLTLADDEFGFGRPWVVRDGSLYRMWYSIRSYGAPYKIGYADSPDGLCWQRKDDEVGIDRSPDGWDSEMICYACVVDAADRRYMFFNGNQHGATGFGVAILEQA